MISIPENEIIYMLSKSTDDDISFVSDVLKSHNILNSIQVKKETTQQQNNLFALIRTNGDSKSVIIARIKTVDQKTGILTFKHLIEGLAEHGCRFSYPDS